MNKLIVQHPSFPSDIPLLDPEMEIVSVRADLEPAGRLIVLLSVDADSSLLTKRIWKLAMTTGMPIQFIGLCKDPSEEPRLRRELVTLSALIRDGRVRAEAKVEIGANWVDVVKQNYQTGDMIVCFPEQRAGLLQKPLSQILQSDLKAPVYILPGLAPENPSRSTWLSQILTWAGSIAIILGSAVLQIQITSLSQNWAQTTLLVLSVIAEAWLIWGWNSLFC